MSTDLRIEYARRITLGKGRLEKAQSREKLTAILRAAFFIAAITLTIIFINSSWIFGIAVPLICLFVFIFLVQRSVRLKGTITHVENLIRINEEEIQFLNGDLSSFKTGIEYEDYQHAYSYDLDIFGDHSIYRMLDRTGTVPGKDQLAAELLVNELDRDVIMDRQQAVQELTHKLDWRQEFLATARQVDFEKDETRELKKWLGGKDYFSSNFLYSLLFILIPLLSVAIPILIGFEILSFYYALYYLLPLALVAFQARKILREQNRLGRFVKLFKKYTGLLLLIENEEFISDYCRLEQDKLKRNNETASSIVNKLSGILWGLETRNNLLMAFLLNAFLLWDIRYMVNLEKWRRSYGDAFEQWLMVIARFEVLNSLACWAFNRYDQVYPELADQAYTLIMEDGGHPLLSDEKRVDNDIAFNGPGQIKIVTGANMAGKSTLLRTVGVNLILAMMGAPVCAKSFIFTPIRIRTSVRTNDSLGDNESYFYAELVKLGRIMDELKKHGPMFVIVDEMLRGTNSRDKHTGSVELIKQLIDLGALGLVATHDIQLGQLKEIYPDKLENKCFEVEINKEQLSFDYKLREGISQNLNATFLMEKMGIIPKNSFGKENQEV
jgi:DNA mismatch repair ATPase MutS